MSKPNELLEETSRNYLKATTTKFKKKTLKNLKDIGSHTDRSVVLAERELKIV